MHKKCKNILLLYLACKILHSTSKNAFFSKIKTSLGFQTKCICSLKPCKCVICYIFVSGQISWPQNLSLFWGIRLYYYTVIIIWLDSCRLSMSMSEIMVSHFETIFSLIIKRFMLILNLQEASHYLKKWKF